MNYHPTAAAPGATALALMTCSTQWLFRAQCLSTQPLLAPLGWAQSLVACQSSAPNFWVTALLGMLRRLVLEVLGLQCPLLSLFFSSEKAAPLFLWHFSRDVCPPWFSPACFVLVLAEGKHFPTWATFKNPWNPDCFRDAYNGLWNNSITVKGWYNLPLY